MRERDRSGVVGRNGADRRHGPEDGAAAWPNRAGRSRSPRSASWRWRCSACRCCGRCSHSRRSRSPLPGGHADDPAGTGRTRTAVQRALVHGHRRRQWLIPEIHRRVVDMEHWLTDAEFAQAFAISQASPGPNMLIVSVIGWKVYGFLGALVATLALCLPSSVLTYGISHVWNRFRDAPLRAAIQRGLAPVTVGLVLASGYVLVRTTDTTWVVLCAHRRDRVPRVGDAHPSALVPARRRQRSAPAAWSEARRMPELPDVVVYVEHLGVAHRRPASRARPPAQSRSCCAPQNRRSPRPKASASSPCGDWASASSLRWKASCFSCCT